MNKNCLEKFAIPKPCACHTKKEFTYHVLSRSEIVVEEEGVNSEVEEK